VVAPPSVHPHGPTYEWIDTEEGQEPPECPSWIVDALRKQAAGSKQLASAKIKGGRHDALMLYAALMRNMGATPAEIEAALRVFIGRLDLSDGRVIEDREIRSVAQWCGDKGMSDVNVENCLHGSSVRDTLLLNAKGAAAELVAEPGVENPGNFPADLLNVPGIVNEWCDYINRTSHRRQPELALAAVLVACGALIGRRLQTVTGGRANLYALGLCETGGGKDRARSAVKEVLCAAAADELIGPEDFASESGLVSSLVAAPVQLFQVDEIGKLLAAIANPRAGSHLVGIVSALLKLYSSAGTVYKGKAYADAAKNPVINQPHVCLYGTAVPDQAWQALGATSVEDGLLARLWVFQASDNKPPRQRPEKGAMSSALVAAIRAWNMATPRGLANSNPDPVTVGRTPEAEAVFSNLEEECDALESRMGDSPLRKLWTRTLQKADQLSLVYAWSVNPDAPKVDESAAVWACKVAEHLTRAMIWEGSRHLAGSQIESDLKAVVRYVHESGKEGRTRSDIVRRFQRIGKRGLGEIMDLAEAGKRVTVRTAVSEGALKPTTTYVCPEFVMGPSDDTEVQ